MGKLQKKIKEKSFEESWETDKMTVLKSVVLVDNVEQIIEEMTKEKPFLDERGWLHYFDEEGNEVEAFNLKPKEVAEFYDYYIKKWLAEEEDPYEAELVFKQNGKELGRVKLQDFAEE